MEEGSRRVVVVKIVTLLTISKRYFADHWGFMAPCHLERSEGAVSRNCDASVAEFMLSGILGLPQYDKRGILRLLLIQSGLDHCPDMIPGAEPRSNVRLFTSVGPSQCRINLLRSGEVNEPIVYNAVIAPLLHWEMLSA